MIDPARFDALEREVVRLSHQLQYVISHLQIAMPPEPSPGSEVVRAMLEKGDVIGAIKAYRIETGAGLAEAKAAVEAIDAQLKGR